MGIFSSICDTISSGLSAIGHAICSVVGKVSTAIVGTVLGSQFAGAVSTLVKMIGIAFPQINIVTAIMMVSSVVSTIAEILKLKEPGKDEPDELAMKAEMSDKKPEDFDSTEAYIKHLQEEINSDEAKERLQGMSVEERSAYRATGTFLYTKCINEKLGFDTIGLQDPRLVGINEGILIDIVKLGDILSPSDFVVYCKQLQKDGLTMDDFSNYLHNQSSVAVDKKVQNAIAAAMTEINPTISQWEIGSKLMELNVEE